MLRHPCGSAVLPDQIVQRDQPINSQSVAYMAKDSDDRYSQGKPAFRANRMPIKASRSPTREQPPSRERTMCWQQRLNQLPQVIRKKCLGHGAALENDVR